MDKIKVGIPRETKLPPDRRVALPPIQAVELLKKFPNIELFVQPSDIRAYTNEEYKELGLTIQENISNCDILIGVKEVNIPALIPGKTYFFFSHTAKKQPFNQGLLKAIIDKKIKLIDYEYLTNAQGVRLVAFGRWAGIVGTYNAMLGYGILRGNYQLRRAHECHDMDEFFGELNKVVLPNIKILISGGGRVAHGAMEVLDHLDLKKVSPQDFLKNDYTQAVYTQIDPWQYTRRKDGDVFDLGHFAKNPDEYESTFLPYTKVTDIYIACHYWDPESPVFMKLEDMQAKDFKISLIADVSCDVNGPIPSTIRAATIEQPFYGFNVKEGKEVKPFDKNHLTVMSVDNLPGEAPRNASLTFANDLIERVLPSLFGKDTDGIIKRASITSFEGKLTENFTYLQDYLDGI